ncbi:unnamed protein product, partial [Amoebophrya sp. A25]|eukprot:GSA25T00021816001.1
MRQILPSTSQVASSLDVECGLKRSPKKSPRLLNGTEASTSPPAATSSSSSILLLACVVLFLQEKGAQVATTSWLYAEVSLVPAVSSSHFEEEQLVDDLLSSSSADGEKSTIEGALPTNVALREALSYSLHRGVVAQDGSDDSSLPRVLIKRASVPSANVRAVRRSRKNRERALAPSKRRSLQRGRRNTDRREREEEERSWWWSPYYWQDRGHEEDGIDGHEEHHGDGHNDENPSIVEHAKEWDNREEGHGGQGHDAHTDYNDYLVKALIFITLLKITTRQALRLGGGRKLHQRTMKKMNYTRVMKIFLGRLPPRPQVVPPLQLLVLRRPVPRFRPAALKRIDGSSWSTSSSSTASTDTLAGRGSTGNFYLASASTAEGGSLRGFENPDNDKHEAEGGNAGEQLSSEDILIIVLVVSTVFLFLCGACSSCEGTGLSSITSQTDEIDGGKNRISPEQQDPNVTTAPDGNITGKAATFKEKKRRATTKISTRVAVGADVVVGTPVVPALKIRTRQVNPTTGDFVTIDVVPSQQYPQPAAAADDILSNIRRLLIAPLYCCWSFFSCCCCTRHSSTGTNLSGWGQRHKKSSASSDKNKDGTASLNPRLEAMMETHFSSFFTKLRQMDDHKRLVQQREKDTASVSSTASSNPSRGTSKTPSRPSDVHDRQSSEHDVSSESDHQSSTRAPSSEDTTSQGQQDYVKEMLDKKRLRLDEKLKLVHARAREFIEEVASSSSSAIFHSLELEVVSYNLVLKRRKMLEAAMTQCKGSIPNDNADFDDFDGTTIKTLLEDALEAWLDSCEHATVKKLQTELAFLDKQAFHTDDQPSSRQAGSAAADECCPSVPTATPVSTLQKQLHALRSAYSEFKSLSCFTTPADHLGNIQKAPAADKDITLQEFNLGRNRLEGLLAIHYAAEQVQNAYGDLFPQPEGEQFPFLSTWENSLHHQHERTRHIVNRLISTHRHINCLQPVHEKHKPTTTKTHHSSLHEKHDKPSTTRRREFESKPPYEAFLTLLREHLKGLEKETPQTRVLLGATTSSIKGRLKVLFLPLFMPL